MHGVMPGNCFDAQWSSTLKFSESEALLTYAKNPAFSQYLSMYAHQLQSSFTYHRGGKQKKLCGI